MDSKRRRKNADSDVAAAANMDEEPKTGRSTRSGGAKKNGTDSSTKVAVEEPKTKPTVGKRGRSKKATEEDAKKDSTPPPAPTDDNGDGETTKGRGKRVAPKKNKDDGVTAGNGTTDSKGDGKSSDVVPKRGRKRAVAAADASGDAADSKGDDKKDEPPARKGRGKTKSAAAVKNDDDDDEDEKGSTSTKSKPAKSAPPTEKVRTITMKGLVPVDEFCPIRDTAHVFCYGDVPYDVMLNQTNVQNNNNKYYMIQLLEDDVGKGFSVWQRWGRVGYDGQNNLQRCGANFETAKKAFYKKFLDKTGNHWEDRDVFEKIGGKYDLVQIDYSTKDVKQPSVDEEGQKSTEPKKKEPPPPSKLSPSVQELLNLISDIRAMENAVKEMKYDAAKAPLGKLTSGQIKAGYAALKAIEGCIRAKNLGQALVQACNEFYTRIPHYFGMKTPPLIRTEEEIKEKIQLLEALNDIEIAIRTLAAGDKESDNNLNPVDKHYEAMKCGLDALEHESDTFKLLEKYLTTTHGATHMMYKLKLVDAFECAKHGEETKFKDVGNRMLLWHGSRLTNWYGILSQGLRIAPPEAPVTGYMFGKGVYFADMSSKSANYCFTTREKNTGLLALCEVALGKTRDLNQADYNADKLPTGFASTKGVGRTTPDQAEFVTLPDGCVVPCGKPKDVTTAAYLQYNEYIVYNTDQIKMKYLLKVEFDYKY